MEGGIQCYLSAHIARLKKIRQQGSSMNAQGISGAYASHAASSGYIQPVVSHSVSKDATMLNISAQPANNKWASQVSESHH